MIIINRNDINKIFSFIDSKGAHYLSLLNFSEEEFKKIFEILNPLLIDSSLIPIFNKVEKYTQTTKYLKLENLVPEFIKSLSYHEISLLILKIQNNQLIYEYFLNIIINRLLES